MVESQAGKEVYNRIHNIDHRLIEALNSVGIIYKTQLATAPEEILIEVCASHKTWKEELPKPLGGLKVGLELHTPIPLYLDEDILVYRRT